MRPLSKAPNPQLLPGRRSIGCPLLRVYVHYCVCALGWVKCRAQIPSMGHHTLATHHFPFPSPLVAQFDALLAIIEPHIKKKTTNFCELSVQGSIFSALCCETKWMNLTIAISVKTPLKMLATDAKNGKNLTRSGFFYDGQKFWRQCVNVIDITWGRIYFSTYENFGWKFRTQCAMTLNVDSTYIYLSKSMCSNYERYSLMSLQNCKTELSNYISSFLVFNWLPGMD